MKPGKSENANKEQHHEQSELLVRLVQDGDEHHDQDDDEDGVDDEAGVDDDDVDDDDVDDDGVDDEGDDLAEGGEKGLEPIEMTDKLGENFQFFSL